jgi:hypothetical protein
VNASARCGTAFFNCVFLKKQSFLCSILASERGAAILVRHINRFLGTSGSHSFAARRRRSWKEVLCLRKLLLGGGRADVPRFLPPYPRRLRLILREKRFFPRGMRRKRMIRCATSVVGQGEVLMVRNEEEKSEEVTVGVKHPSCIFMCTVNTASSTGRSGAPILPG